MFPQKSRGLKRKKKGGLIINCMYIHTYTHRHLYAGVYKCTLTYMEIIKIRNSLNNRMKLHRYPDRI